MPRRRNVRRRRNVISRLNRRLNFVEKSLGWTVHKGRDDPPRIVDNPAWPLVIAVRGVPTEGGTKTYTVNNMGISVLSQLGFSDLSKFQAKFRLRFSRVDVWYTGDYIHPIALRLYDLASGEPSPWAEDIGTPARNAHVHMSWPKAQQTRWFLSDSGSKIFDIDHFAKTDFQIHVHVHISFTQGDPIPTYRRVDELVDDLNVLVLADE